MRRRLSPIAFCLALLLALIAPLSAQRSAAPNLAGFDQWVTSVMAEWKVPGLAVGAVQDGKVVFIKGTGFATSRPDCPLPRRP